MFDASESRRPGCVSNYGQMNLLNRLHKLWEEHVVWTRLFIISTLAELPDLEATTRRLLRNPSDFVDVLAIYYGKQKADQFRSLLEEHLKIGASVVKSAKRNDAKAMEQYSKLWYSNADRIAGFLAAINPYWDENDWKDLLHDHLRLTTDEVTARLAGDFVKDVIIFDMIQEQALGMADVMTAGMIRQFNL